MATITLRLDDKEKKELDNMVDEMGMTLTTFYMIYTKRALRDRKIPFEISAPEDPFYSKENMDAIKKADEEVKNGHVVVRSLDELEKMANE